MKKSLLVICIFICTFIVACGGSKSDSDKIGQVNVKDSVLPDGELNQPYTATIEGTGGNGQYIVSLESGELPAGLELSADGTITGTITGNTGEYSFTILIKDAANESNSHTATVTITVIYNASEITIINPILPMAGIGKEYSARIECNGGYGKYEIELVEGELPAGLELATDGVVSGTVEDEQFLYSFEIVAKDAVYPENSIRKQIQLAVYEYLPDESEPIGPTGEELPASVDVDVAAMVSGSNKDYTFHFDSDVDFIFLDLTNIEELTSCLLRLQTDELRVQLNVFDPDGWLIASNDDLAGELLFDVSEPGLYTLQTREVDQNLGEYRVTFLNTGTPFTMTTAELPMGELYSEYNLQINANGGSGNFIYEIQGELPSGLDFDENGMISGVIEGESGEYPVTISVIDAEFETVIHQDFTLTTMDFLPDEYENDDSSFTENVVVPGTESQVHTFHSEADQDYVRLNLSEIETDQGIVVVVESDLEIRVSIIDENENLIASNLNSLYWPCGESEYFISLNEINNADGRYTLRVVNGLEPVRIQNTSLQSGIINQVYHQEIVVVGGYGNYIYEIDNLPAGLTFNGGVISGIPTESGAPANIFIRVSDARYPQNYQEITLLLRIVGVLNVQTKEIPGGVRGDAYNAKINVSGGFGQYNFSATGLPNGLSINASTGVISGNPTKAGDYTLSVTVRDYQPVQPRTIELSLKIVEPLEITTTQLPIIINNPNGGNANMYSANLQARGGYGTYKFSHADGVMPKKLSLEASGRLTGAVQDTPRRDYSFTVQVADTTSGRTATRLLAATVYDPIAVNFGMPRAMVGRQATARATATGGSGNYTFRVVNSWPTAYSCEPNGMVHVTFGSAGNNQVVIEARDTITGQTGNKTFTTQVAPPLQIINSHDQSPYYNKGCLDADVKFTATGGFGAPYTFSMPSGGGGLVVAPNGDVNGRMTINNWQAYNVSNPTIIRVVDSAGFSTEIKSYVQGGGGCGNY